MPELSKNHAARLRKVNTQLDKSLDSLMQANGLLWPKELRPYGNRLQEAVDTLQALSKAINEHVEGAILTPDSPDNGPGDPNQEDVEDVEGVAQPQPNGSAPVSSRRRRGEAA